MAWPLAILFLVHNQFVKTALLMGGGQVELETGTGKLNEFGGLAASKPVLATVFFVAAFALAGFPLTSGFVAKLGLLASDLCHQLLSHRRRQPRRQRADHHEHDPPLAVYFLGQSQSASIRRRAHFQRLTST